MAITKATASSIAPAAKGDLVVGSATNDASILAVGTNTHILTADSSTATGLKWAAATTTQNFTLISTTTLTGATSITISSLSGYNQLAIHLDGLSTANANPVYDMRLNSDSTQKYSEAGVRFTTTPGVYGFQLTNYSSATSFYIGTGDGSAGGYAMGVIRIDGANSSGVKPVSISVVTSTNATGYPIMQQGFYSGTSVISSITLISSSGNFDAGTVRIFGAA